MYSKNKQSSAKITRKFSWDRWEIFMVKQHVEFVKNHYDPNEDTSSISLVQLQNAQRDINDLKRALKIYQIKRNWFDLLKEHLNGESEVSRD
jgi:hypothetical protein